MLTGEAGFMILEVRESDVVNWLQMTDTHYLLTLADDESLYYSAFLAGLGLAATIRITRAGLRWVKRAGSDSGGGSGE